MTSSEHEPTSETPLTLPGESGYPAKPPRIPLASDGRPSRLASARTADAGNSAGQSLPAAVGLPGARFTSIFARLTRLWNLPSAHSIVLLILGIVGIPICQRILTEGDITHATWGGLGLTICAMTGINLMGIAIIRYSSAGTGTGSQGALSRWLDVGLIIAIGLAMRAVFWPEPPLFSNDAYRYVWDGRLLLHGISPYMHTIDDPALAVLRDTHIWPFIGYRQDPTIYPPGAEYFYAVIGWISPILAPNLPAMAALKVGLACCDGMVALLTILLLRQKGLDPRWVILYWWSPIPILEFALNAHIDVLAIAWTLGAVALYHQSLRLQRADTRFALDGGSGLNPPVPDLPSGRTRPFGRWRIVRSQSAPRNISLLHCGVGICVAMAALTKIYPLLFIVAFLRAAPDHPVDQGLSAKRQSAPDLPARASVIPGKRLVRHGVLALRHTVVLIRQNWLLLSSCGSVILLAYLPFLKLGLGGGGFLGTYLKESYMDQGALHWILATVSHDLHASGTVLIILELLCIGVGCGFLLLYRWHRLAPDHPAAPDHPVNTNAHDLAPAWPDAAIGTGPSGSSHPDPETRRIGANSVPDGKTTADLSPEVSILLISAIWMVFSPHIFTWYVALPLPLIAVLLAEQAQLAPDHPAAPDHLVARGWPNAAGSRKPEDDRQNHRQTGVNTLYLTLGIWTFVLCVPLTYVLFSHGGIPAIFPLFFVSAAVIALWPWIRAQLAHVWSWFTLGREDHEAGTDLPT